MHAGYDVRRGQMDFSRDSSSFFRRMRATMPARVRLIAPAEAPTWTGRFQEAIPQARHAYIFVRSNDKVKIRDCRCDALDRDTLAKLE